MHIKNIIKIIVMTFLYSDLYGIINLLRDIINPNSYLYYDDILDHEIERARDKHNEKLKKLGIKVA